MEVGKQQLSELLEVIKSKIGDIPETIERAFLCTPRHHFADKFLKKNEEETFEEIELSEKNITEYIPELYEDRPILLMADKEGNIISSISQPSLVLSMLIKLDIKAGEKILEIGTASGWNAAMMSKLVGEEGHIYSIEIISELVTRARLKFEGQGADNITLFDGDGAIEKYKETFDKIMFTVGSYYIPGIIQKQLKENGNLLMVLKNKGLWDSLLLLTKKENYLESTHHSACGFVPLKGEYAMPELDFVTLESLSIWDTVKEQITFKQSFWWGMKYDKKPKDVRRAAMKIVGITSFLGIVEPQFQMFKDDNDEIFFGLVDDENNSLAVWKNDQLIGYGNNIAIDKLKANFELFLSLGMPNIKCFTLKVYSIDEKVNLNKNEWLIKRRDAQFVWSLNEDI